MEKYISFTLDYLKILDSYQFMTDSLAKLVNNLREAKYDFPITKQVMRKYYNLDNSKFNLLLRKGVYPYEYMDSFDKFNDTDLPDIEKFYSKLNFDQLSEDDYKHAKEVWNEFEIENMGDYHNLYLMLDTCLLADVFQVFRKMSLKEYKLDPCHFYSAAGLAWSAALKHTNVELELLTDIDMIQFIEKGMRGGISQVSKRISKANNKYMTEYDKNKKSTFLTYLDGKIYYYN